MAEEEKKRYVPGHGYPVKVLYRPLKISIAGVEVILGPETELLVGDEHWHKIYELFQSQGFSDKEWEEGSGEQCRSIPTTSGQWKHSEHDLREHAARHSAIVAKALKLDAPAKDGLSWEKNQSDDLKED